MERVGTSKWNLGIRLHKYLMNISMCIIYFQETQDNVNLCPVVVSIITQITTVNGMG